MAFKARRIFACFEANFIHARAFFAKDPTIYPFLSMPADYSGQINQAA